MKHLAALLMLLNLEVSGFSQEVESGVVGFDYGGFSDTSVALLKVSFNLDELELKILLGNTVVKNARVESNDFLGFTYGHWNLMFCKTGYDTIFINDYYAVPDQISEVQLHLSGGNQKITYTTHPPSYLFPKNGTDSSFFESGRLQETRTFRNDTLIAQVDYFENGSLRYQLNRLENGLTTALQYYDNGQLESIGIGNNTLTEGYRLAYFKNGGLREHLLNTAEGQLVWTRLDSSGVYIVKNGNTLLSYRRANDLATRTNLYKHGLKDGKWIWNNQEGKKWDLSEEKKGKSLKVYWYKNGVLRREKYWVNGKLQTNKKYDDKGRKK